MQQVLEQMARLYRVMRHQVRPNNPALYAVMAEGPCDLLQRFQQEIDQYIGLAELREEGADIWLRIRGAEVEWKRAPTSILTSFLNAFRKGVQLVAEYLDRGTLTTRPTKELLAACDLRLVGLLPGSVQIGLRLPEADEADEAGGGASGGLPLLRSIPIWKLPNGLQRRRRSRSSR